MSAENAAVKMTMYSLPSWNSQSKRKLGHNYLQQQSLNEMVMEVLGCYTNS